jgi:hypothetical protein
MKVFLPFEIAIWSAWLFAYFFFLRRQSRRRVRSARRPGGSPGPPISTPQSAGDREPGGSMPHV